MSGLVECQRVEKDPIFRFFVRGEFQWKPFTMDFRNVNETTYTIDSLMNAGDFSTKMTVLLSLLRFTAVAYNEEGYPYTSLESADIASAIKKRSVLFESEPTKLEFNPLERLEVVMNENRDLYGKYIDQLNLKFNALILQLQDAATRTASVANEQKQQMKQVFMSFMMNDSQFQMLIQEFMRMRRQIFFNPFLGQEEDVFAFPPDLPQNDDFFTGKNTYIKFMRNQRQELMRKEVNDHILLRIKMIEKGILVVPFEEVFDGKRRTYFMILLPAMYALYWANYYDERLLGDAFKKTYMSSTRVLLRKLAKNPEKYIDAKYAQAINFLKYGSVSFSIYKKAVATPTDLDKPDKVTEWYQTGNFNSDTTKLNDENQILTEYRQARPEGMTAAQQIENMGPPTKISYLKMVDGNVQVSSMPFWLNAFDVDKRGKNLWMAVVIDMKNCPDLPREPKSPAQKELLRDNAIYRIADLIMRAFRDQCSFRLAQTYVSYKNEMIERKKAQKLSVYATGYEDAYPVGDSRVEYPSGPEDGLGEAPRQVVAGRVRALYFERIGVPKAGGRLSFKTEYAQEVPTIGKTEDLPENVKKSIKCIGETCRIDSPNIAIGPLMPGSRPQLPSQIAMLDCGKPGGLDFETARRLAVMTGINTENMNLDGICEALKTALAKKLNM